MRSGRVLFALIVCLLPLHVQAQQVTIKANHNPGDSYTFDQAMTMQLNMTISMNGQQNPVQQNMGQNRAGKVQVLEAQGGQATKATVVFSPNCTGYMETVGQGKQDQPFALNGQTVTAVRQQDGSYTLEGNPGADASEVDDYVKIEEGMFPKRPVSPGDSWDVAPEEFAKAMQMDPSAKGSAKAKLVSVDSVGGRQVASIDINLSLEGDQPGAGHMTMQLTGTVKIDVATGRTVGGNLAGPLTMAGQPQPGMDLKGNGRLNLTFNGSVSGGGAVVNPNPFPNPNPVPAPNPNPNPNPFDPGAGAANFVGDFKNDKLEMHVTKGAFENYEGLITMKGNMYKFTATAQGSTLTGKFQVEANSFDFTATLNGNQMTFKTGSSTYDLKRETGAKNPLE